MKKGRPRSETQTKPRGQIPRNQNFKFDKWTESETSGRAGQSIPTSMHLPQQIDWLSSRAKCCSFEVYLENVLVSIAAQKKNYWGTKRSRRIEAPYFALDIFLWTSVNRLPRGHCPGLPTSALRYLPITSFAILSPPGQDKKTVLDLHLSVRVRSWGDGILCSCPDTSTVCTDSSYFCSWRVFVFPGFGISSAGVK